jgi:alpha-beta hydrolase superfamily lysophospholipase
VALDRARLDLRLNEHDSHGLQTVIKLAPIVTLLIFAWVLLSPMVAMPFYNSLIFNPESSGNFYPAVIDHCPVETHWLRAPDGNRIFSWYVRNPHASKTILLSHGSCGDLSDCVGLINKLVAAGASVFAYDYEGFGLSQGTPGVDVICADGLAAYDYLRLSRHIQPSDIILFGESLGTGVSCQLCAERPSGGMILQSAFTSLLSVAREHVNVLYLYPDIFFPRQRLDSMRILSGKHPPVLLVHGALDQTVPVAHAEKLFAKATAPKQLVILPDAEHEDMPTTDSPRYDAALRHFIHAV